jgi:hypothetical protein
MRRLAPLLVIAFVAAGCAHPAESHDGSAPPPATGLHTIAGVYLRHGSAAGGSGRPTAGVRVGLYLRPIVFGPVMADPPHPIQVVRTGAGGRFTFTGLRSGRRYFVIALDNRAYTVGTWARPGTRVSLTGCTTCARPM